MSRFYLGAFLLALAVVGGGAARQSRRFGTQPTNCGCQCSPMTLQVKYGRTIGNCLSSYKGSLWCYIDSWTSPCSDLRKSSKTNKPWSYQACVTPATNLCSNSVAPGGWGQWESWSQCSTTCGQGTQIRRRACSDYNNYCYGRKEERRPCTINRRRVRKNVASLSLGEKYKLQRALREAIASKVSLKNYEDNALFHGAPRTLCPNNPPWGICCPHGSTDFLTWHRLFMTNMEELLGHPLPYWDWTESGDVPDLWENISAPIKPPHTSSATDCIGNDVTQHRRARSIQIDAQNMKQRVRMALEETRFDLFSIQVEEPHNFIHGDLGCDMSNPLTAAYDPLFYLHHSYIDYLFAYWQELQRLRKESGEITEEVDLSIHNTIMEPFNRNETNPYQITLQNSQGRDAFDYQNNFCYQYEELMFDGMNPKQFLEVTRPIFPRIVQDRPIFPRQDRRKENARIFVGIVEPKVAPTSRINFEICSSQNHCVNGGTVATFGPSLAEALDTRRDTTDNYVVVEYEVTNIFKEEDGFDEKASAHIISTDDQDAMTDLQPIVIWRYNSGVNGGTVYLGKGVTKNVYGDLLDKYETVVENGTV